MSTTTANPSTASADAATHPWYYAVNGEKRGPCTFDALVRELRSGRLPLDTRVWSASLVTWTAASDVAVLMSAIPPAAPEVPQEPAAASAPASGVPPQAAEARPWTRYWARVVDSVVAGVVAGIVLAFVAPAALKNSVVLMLVAWLLWVPLEATLVTTFGATPGKALMAIRVRDRAEQLLDFSAALRRSVWVYFAGMGLGIPLVAFVTTIVGYNRLTKTHSTSWDEKAGSVVSHGRIGAGRTVLIVIVALAIIGLIALGEAS